MPGPDLLGERRPGFGEADAPRGSGLDAVPRTSGLDPPYDATLQKSVHRDARP